MALQLFPDVSKTTTVSDGTNYAYIHIPPADSTKPTFLLLHGFPSSTFEWRHVVPILKEHKYGILAPDLLGYGDTDKPADLAAYQNKRMSDHVIEILRTEGLTQVIGVGHDWGSTLLSLMALVYPTYFSGIAFLAVGYVAPGSFDIKQMNSIFTQHAGYPAFAYMEFFNEDGAAALVDANPASLTSLLYSTRPEDVKIHMGVEGAAKNWISAGKVTPPPPWMSEEDVATHIRIFRKGGYTGPLNWYKSKLRNIDEPYYSTLTEEDKNSDIPALVVTAAYDYAVLAEFQTQPAEKHLRNLRIENMKCTHWIPSEKPEECVALLENWASSL